MIEPIYLAPMGMFLMLLVTIVCRLLGVPTSTSTATLFDKIKNASGLRLLRMTFIVCAFGPVVEELVFRYLPSLTGWGWYIGVPVALVFALGHIGNFKERHWPVSHFVGGLFFWWVMEQYGITTAILTHVLHNSFVLGCAVVAIRSGEFERAQANLERARAELREANEINLP